MGRRVRLFFRAVKELSANPKMLRQVVFGREEGTRGFNVVEAVGFSCSVPGLFNYDVFHDDPFTISTLENLFERHRLWRLTDGGIVNNVPSRVAWESVMMGSLGTRNAFVFAADPFAPTGANLIFAPVQQVARPAVVANRPFSDFHKTFKSAPGPANLSPGFSKLKRIQNTATRELEPHEPYLKKVMTPLPSYGFWGESS
jgi:predicted acylesterase/phospholipase RssA